MEHGSVLFKVTRAIGLSVVRIFSGLVRLSGGREPFISPSMFPFTGLMENNWRAIREEALSVMNDGGARNIQEIFKEQDAITQGDNWRSYMLMIYGHVFKEHMERCPVTSGLILQEPRVSSAMFSILAPGASLRPHRGPYKGVLRYHLALIVPGDGSECELMVGDVRRNWVEGGSLLFDDTFLHAAHNRSRSPRVVLFIDLIRPLPFPLDRLNRSLFSAIARSAFIQNVLREASKVEHVTFWRARLRF